MDITALPISIIAYLIIVAVMIVCFAVSCLYSYVARRWMREIDIPLQRLIEACQSQPSDDSEYHAVPVVEMLDDPVHDDEHPRCDDPECPCNEQECNREPECPPGYFWNGRQCLRENGWPTLSLAEREGL